MWPRSPALSETIQQYSVLKAKGNIWNAHISSCCVGRTDDGTNAEWRRPLDGRKQCVSQVRRRCAVNRKWRLARSTDRRPRYWSHRIAQRNSCISMLYTLCCRVSDRLEYTACRTAWTGCERRCLSATLKSILFARYKCIESNMLGVNSAI